MPFPRLIASRVEGESLLRLLRAVEHFEDALKRGESPPLEDLLREAVGAERAELLRQALGVELDYRRGRGECPDPEEYLRRFPGDAAVVRDAFQEPTVAYTPEPNLAPPPGPGPLPKKIGKYDVLGRLGGGGQGSAYLARDPDLGHLVVLKRYHASGGDPRARGAVLEGKELVRLRSRYIPQCFGIERVGDEVVLVMEYVPGPNLSEVIEAGRPSPGASARLPSPGASARLIEQVAEGLEAVHACGLVHRDIKPANVVRGDDGVPRLVDLGLAAHLGSAALHGISGTPQYMAPEQARDQWERIDGRTDVYGLGAVLYALLTGQPPHPGAQEQALDHARRGEVKPPRELNRSIPRPLEAIVLRAMAADPSQRYATAAELRRALRLYRLRWARRASIVSAGVLALAVVVWEIWPPARKDSTTQLNTTRSVPAALAGELTVRVWTPGGKGKRGWSVEDPRTLPVLAGEQVRLVARLNQPAYAYLLMLDGQGQVSSLHPWSNHHFGPRPAAETKQETVDSPAAIDKGWTMTGPGGLETALLLVRRTPLPADTDLAALIGRLPPTPLRDPREVVVRGFDEGQPTESLERELNRGIVEEASRIDDPLLQLMERLRKRGQFDLIKTVRFAYQGK